jgi:diphthamide biosynthesis protein 4
MTASAARDYYTILGIQQSASFEEIKRAYHRALLAHHPDKRAHPSTPPVPGPSNLSTLGIQPTPDVDTLRAAFATLSSPRLRAEYDISLARGFKPSCPRPAQMLSLEDFSEGDDDAAGIWTYPCRCGGVYKLGEAEMDQGQHLVGCGSCSEVVWVGYEVVDENIG